MTPQRHVYRQIVLRVFLLTFILLTASSTRLRAQSATGATSPSSTTLQAPPARPLVTTAVTDSNLVTLAHSVHPLARPEFDQGPAPPDLPMNRMLLVLKRSAEQETALDQLLIDQQTKTSSNYKKWVTPEQFGQLFGPADSDIQAVTAWLGSHGFNVARVTNGKTIIEFSGTAAQVQEAFHTQIHKFTVHGEDHWANATDPQIPAALAPVIQGFASLHNFVKHPAHHIGGIAGLPNPSFQLGRTIMSGLETGGHRQNTSGAMFAGAQSGPIRSGPPSKIGPSYEIGGTHGLVPGDFATIYNVAPLWAMGIDGTGQTIGIVGRTDLNVGDVNTFRSLFNLPVNPPVVILDGNDPGDLGPDEDVEAQLDAEWSGAIAKAATIKFVISESTTSTDGVDLSALYIVDNNIAQVMSESFSECEFYLGTNNQFYANLWQQAVAQGITPMVAAGDSGSAECDGDDGDIVATLGTAVSGIAATPYDIAVGGTSFDLSVANYSSTFWNPTNNPTTQSSAKSYIPETTWSDSCAQDGLTSCIDGPPNGTSLDLTAGGGGPSSCLTANTQGVCTSAYPKPAWQTGNGVPADGVRDIPDVSLFSDFTNGNSYYFVCASEATGSPCTLTDFLEVGGTSAASPTFAGIMALVNHYRATLSNPAPRQGNANYVLYPLANQTNASCNSSLAATITNTSCVFYDITKGNNSVICGANSPDCSISGGQSGWGVEIDPNNPTTEAWTTTAGYDRATGLGSVNAYNLATNWSSITLAASSISLSLNGGTAPISITHGQSVSVSGSVTGTGTPTGQVSLISNAASGSGITDFALSGGTYSGSTSLFPGGNYTVQAHYNGDGSFGASNSSPAINLTVTPENSSVNLYLVTNVGRSFFHTPNPSTIPYGSQYYLRGDVANSQGQFCQWDPLDSNGGVGTSGVGCATGSVGISDGGNALNSFTLNSQGFFEDLAIQLPAGVHPLQANYFGDSSYFPSNGINTLTVTQAPTEISLIAYYLTIPSTLTETLMATITTQAISSSSLEPTGNVQFFLNGNALGSPVAVSGRTIVGFNEAIAQLVTTTLPVGTDNITVQYLGDNNYAQSPVSDPAVVTVLPPPANLSLVKSHTGNFVAGSTGVYNLAVTNSGVGPTTGPITISDSLPNGLTFASVAGAGWSSTSTVGGPAAVLTSTTQIPVGGTRTALLTVNVPPTAPQIVNIASVFDTDDSAPDGANKTSSDLTNVNEPDMTITEMSANYFVLGEVGATLTFTATNSGNEPTTAPVSVVETLGPGPGVTPTGLSGSGWNCNLGSGTCTRSDVLAGGASYPPITLTVNIASIAPNGVNFTAVVSGGGEGNTSNDQILGSIPTLTPPTATLSTATLTFPSTPVGSSAPTMTVTVTDNGGAALMITAAPAITSTDATDFAIIGDSTCIPNATVFGNGGTCVINVAFTPGAAGPRGPATLTVTDSASPSTQTVTLMGTGEDFTMGGPTSPVTVTAGQTAMYSISISPGPGGFPSSVSFSASGLPSESSASFQPPAFAPGSTIASTTLSILTTANTSGNTSPLNLKLPASPWRILLWPVVPALIAAILMIVLRKNYCRQRPAWGGMALVLLFVAVGFVGCGGGGGGGGGGGSGGNFGTPAGTYTITVTATSSSLSHSTTVTLTVQ